MDRRFVNILYASPFLVLLYYLLDQSGLFDTFLIVVTCAGVLGILLYFATKLPNEDSSELEYKVIFDDFHLLFDFKGIKIWFL